MGITDLFKKIKGFAKSEIPAYPKVSPEQMELKSFIKQEKIDTEKRLLAEYRKNNNDEMFSKNPFMVKDQFMNQKNVFASKRNKGGI